MWKGFLYFTRGERRSVIVIVVLIILVGSGFWIIPKRVEPTQHIDEFNEQYQTFIGSLQQVEEKGKSYPSNKRYAKAKEAVLSSFDPNTTDSLSFVELGLPGWMIKNIINYRNKGGVFKKAEDFAKIYGLKEEQFLALASFIDIDTMLFASKDTTHYLIAEARRDSFPKTIKFEKGTIVDINHADTTQLKMIPGIGSAIARTIINYRTQLGGYYSINQLKEIRLQTDSLHSWFNVSPDSITQLAVNKMGVESLLKHPYLNFYQAKTIVEHRRKNGKIRGMNELKLYEEFAQTDLERLSFYLCFD